MPIRNLPHLWCHSHNTAVSRLKGQRLGSPGPLMLTHIMRYMLRTARPTNFKLGIHGWRTTTRISHRRMTSNVKSQGRKVTWSVWAVLAQCCTCVISGRRGHTVSADPGGHFSSYTVIYICIRQMAAATNKSESKTNATDRWTASFTNKELLDNSWS